MGGDSSEQIGYSSHGGLSGLELEDQVNPLCLIPVRTTTSSHGRGSRIFWPISQTSHSFQIHATA